MNAQEAIDRIQELHIPVGSYVQRCQACTNVLWPCNTARILQGIGIQTAEDYA